MKNTTRMSSLMGTWSGQTHLKAKIGPYSVSAYFVAHLLPDPMRSYGCVEEECSEFFNQACVIHDDRKKSSHECVSMTDGTLPWSDVSAFFYFGARVDVGIPFNKHVQQELGGWVGPISMILAQAPIDDEVNSPDTTSPSAAQVVDRYVMRYVDTPSTPYLHMPPNCSFMGVDDFEKNLGRTAIRNSISLQNGTSASQSMKNVTADDPYRRYLQTCDNGDVEPIMPQMEFRFLQGATDDGNTTQERIQVLLNYKVMTVPDPSKPIYKLFPMVQSKLNQRGVPGFHIGGPYCYKNDPKRGYTFDLSYDSLQESDYMELVHGCVDGLPACLPPPAELLNGGDTEMITIHTTGTIGGDVLWMLLCIVLTVALCTSVFCNFRQWRGGRVRMAAQQPITNNGNADNQDALTQPLLESQPQTEESKKGTTTAEEETAQSAEVTFV